MSLLARRLLGCVLFCVSLVISLSSVLASSHFSPPNDITSSVYIGLHLQLTNHPMSPPPPTSHSLTMASSSDLSALRTPPSCTADFCLIPLGTPTASVSKEVAEVQRLLKKSGLNFSMHSAGTTVGALDNPLPGGRHCAVGRWPLDVAVHQGPS